MTINDYEAQGGFREELRLIRTIGESITTMQDMLPARPHRDPEADALRKLANDLEFLRAEICKTREAAR